MSGESKNMSEVSEVNQQDRETRLRHQFQTHWDRREQLHERDLTELRQQFQTKWDAREQALKEVTTRKEWLERELARITREWMAVRQEAEILRQGLSNALRRETAYEKGIQ